MPTIDAPQSLYIDGQWHDATWAMRSIDGETGELVITAVLDSNPPLVTALRLDMTLARNLRQLAGFAEEELLTAEPRYDCRTLEDRLAELEMSVAGLRADIKLLDAATASHIEDFDVAQRVDKLEKTRLRQQIEDALDDFLLKPTATTAQFSERLNVVMAAVKAGGEVG